jgi:hypothetical protein
MPVVPAVTAREPAEADRDGFRSRGRRSGSREPGREATAKAEPVVPKPARVREPVVERIARPAEVEPPLSVYEEDSIEEIGRPEGPLDERHIDPFGIGAAGEPELAGESPEFVDQPTGSDPEPAWEVSDVRHESPAIDRLDDEPAVGPWAVPDGQDGLAEDDAPRPVVTPPVGGQAAGSRSGRRRARRRP